jgi:hypothetical protein
MFGITDISIDFLTRQSFLTWLIFILFLLLAVMLYRRTNPPLSRGIRILLTALRIIAVTALFLTLFEPVISLTREYLRKPRLSVLIDKSGSMETSEGGKSRIQRLDSLINSAGFKEFVDNFDSENLTFTGELENADVIENQNITALGNIIEDLAKRRIGRPDDVWLLMSDGISNSGISPAEISGETATPIYTVGFGSASSGNDISLGELEYNPVVFAGKPTTLKWQLSWRNDIERKITFKVKDAGKILVSREMTISPGDLKEDVSISFVPDRPGQRTFELNVSALPDEINRENNHRSFSMTVLKGKNNILLVSGQIDWEYSFLKRFLEQSESVALTEAIYDKQGGFITGRFPTRQEELNQYDLVILYDVSNDAFDARKDIIDSYLKDKGGSLLIILGRNYSGTRSGSVNEFLPFVSTRSNSGLRYFKFSGRPAENYLFHPAVRIAENRRSIREKWRELPPFEALVPTDSTAPNSKILVTSDIAGGKISQPLIGYRIFIRGKVLATAALPFWHWAFYGYGFGKDDAEYREFFDGIINWLVIREDSDPITVTPDKNIFTRGEKIGFSAAVFDLGFRPIDDAFGQVLLIDENGIDTVIVQLISSGEGSYRAEFDFIAPGRYTFIGTIEKDDMLLKESSGQIAVESFTIEEIQTRPDFSLLNTISAQSGGSFVVYSDIDILYDEIDKSKIRVNSESEIAIWNKFWLLTLFILSLGLEWFIRKRYQLI